MTFTGRRLKKISEKKEKQYQKQQKKQKNCGIKNKRLISYLACVMSGVQNVGQRL